MNADIFVKSYVLAWNEDTVHRYYIAMLRDYTFYYTIDSLDFNQGRKEATWRGFWRSSHDTIYLHFQGNGRPPMRNYLIWESSGCCLIQYFVTDQPRMFLRRQRTFTEMR
jgi:hypothetical protein